MLLLLLADKAATEASTVLTFGGSLLLAITSSNQLQEDDRGHAAISLSSHLEDGRPEMCRQRRLLRLASAQVRQPHRHTRSTPIFNCTFNCVFNGFAMTTSSAKPCVSVCADAAPLGRRVTDCIFNWRPFCDCNGLGTASNSTDYLAPRLCGDSILQLAQLARLCNPLGFTGFTTCVHKVLSAAT